MVRGSQLILRALALLLQGCLSKPLTGGHTLLFTFTVQARTATGQHWYEVQCLVDGVSFLQYDNVNKPKPLDNWEEKITATQEWKHFIHDLEQIGKTFRDMLLNTTQEELNMLRYPILMATMLYLDDGKIKAASWSFNISRQYLFTFQSANMTWTTINTEAKDMMQKWENDAELRKTLMTISTADCAYWLKEFPKYHKKIPGPILNAHDLTQLLPSTQLPSTTQLPPPTTSRSHLYIILPVLFIFIGIIVVGIIVVKSHHATGGEE